MFDKRTYRIHIQSERSLDKIVLLLVILFDWMMNAFFIAPERSKERQTHRVLANRTKTSGKIKPPIEIIQPRKLSSKRAYAHRILSGWMCFCCFFLLSGTSNTSHTRSLPANGCFFCWWYSPTVEWSVHWKSISILTAALESTYVVWSMFVPKDKKKGF